MRIAGGDIFNSVCSVTSVVKPLWIEKAAAK